MYPEADIPVIQLSLNRRLREPAHFDIARSLAPLRDEGVLILGSGNVVHNLGDVIARMNSGNVSTPAWARDFDATVAKAVLQRDARTLLSLWSGTDAGKLAHPLPDHWLPLIYTLGASDERDEVRFENEGFDLGSLSMRSMVWSASS